MCIVLLNLVFIYNISHAELACGVLEKYKNNDIFICLGIYGCVNLARALNAGFTQLHGIDNDPILLSHARTIFPRCINENRLNVTNYHFYYGGIVEFKRIIFQINQPMTILLGSHYPNVNQIPFNKILEEIDIIKSHPIKSHTILIDHINYADTPAFGYVTLDAIKDKLRDINLQYAFALEKGGRLEKEENAVLVAYIEEVSFVS